jgi:hypothetical protein
MPVQMRPEFTKGGQSRLLSTNLSCIIFLHCILVLRYIEFLRIFAQQPKLISMYIKKIKLVHEIKEIKEKIEAGKAKSGRKFQKFLLTSLVSTSVGTIELSLQQL